MKTIVQLIKQGKIGVLPTDTIYGIHGSAFIPSAIEKMYTIRVRDMNKPFIVLVASIGDLKKFGVKLSETQSSTIQYLWRQRVSVVLPVTEKILEYLTRGTGSIAFRMPQRDDLIHLINQTGPLVSTSVNVQGGRPAETIEAARTVFGDKLDFYIDSGTLTSQPSTVVKLTGEYIEIVRQGATVISLKNLIKSATS